MTVLKRSTDIRTYVKNINTVVALGYFDGVHQGHQALLKCCVREAEARQGLACALLLEPHPLEVLSHNRSVHYLNTLEQRIQLIQRQGPIDVFVLDFTKAFAQLSPEIFVKEYLVNMLNAKAVVAGFNYSFGNKGAGHCQDLKIFGQRYGFEAFQVPPVKIEGNIVSSTLIRSCLKKGEMEEAATYLGHPHIFAGTVVGGNRLGSLLGFPTANVALSERMQWPAFGVYGGWIKEASGEVHRAVINVGIRPTVEESVKKPSFEAHLLEYDGDLYGQTLQIMLTDRLRNEIRFDHLEALKDQVMKDKKNAIAALDQIALRHGGPQKNISELFFTCL